MIDKAASYALDALMKAGADKASCSAGRGRKDEFNVEANKFTLLRTLFNDHLFLKVIKEGKKGEIAINKLDKDSINSAVADCIALTEQATPDEAHDIAPMVENKVFTQRIGGSDMAALFAKSKDFIEQIGDEFPKIMIEGMTAEFNSGESTYMNSNGVHFTGDSEFYSAGCMFSAKDGEKSTSFNGYGSNIRSLDTPFIDLGMQRTLLEESVKSLDTRMVDEKFVGKVIVTPACVDMIWYSIVSCFLSDFAMIQGTSRWKDALGTLVADPKLTLRSAPLHPDMVCAERYTGDGFESKDYDLIKDGVLNSFALSLYGSKKTGKPMAANSAWNFEIPSGDTALSDMIKGVDKGILLNRFSGASPGASGDISGVAKNSFLIENGQVTDALAETMVGFNLVDVVKNITAISKERISDGMSVLPWCCFDGITISGGN